MTPERLRLRAVWGLGMVLAVLGLLVVRLAWIQLVECAEARRSARRQQFTRVETVKAQRGRLLDRNGAVLAETASFPSIAVNPRAIREPARFASIVEQETGIPAATVAAAVARGGHFRWVRRQVRDRAAVERLCRRVASERIAGLDVREEPLRVHPLGALGAHVLGFTDRDGRGLEGIEALREKELAGKDGRRVTLRDAAGLQILTANQPFDPPEDGRDVRLTIDHVIQSFAEEAANQSWTDYRAQGVVAAVVDVRTGDLLAVACRPTFDPDDASRTTPDQRRNRFFVDAFEPGSVFKPIVMAAALDAGVITPETPIDARGGVLRMRGRTIHEDKDHDYGVIRPREIIARSSNVAMARIGLLLGCERMKSSLRVAGFGTRTALRWPGEQTGSIQAERRWRDSDQLVSMAFGHAMTATPAQILQAYATLAGGGVRREFRLLADAPRTEPVRVVGEAAANALIPMMEAVTTGDGTAAHAARNCPDFPTAGKTGTAQKLQTGGHVSSFACFGPSDEPRLAVLVLVDEPRKATYGSVVAAPHALRVLRQSLHYLRVEPGEDGVERRRAARASAAVPSTARVFVPSEVAPR